MKASLLSPVSISRLYYLSSRPDDPGTWYIDGQDVVSHYFVNEGIPRVQAYLYAGQGTMNVPELSGDCQMKG
jgi:hypothetical protein